MSDDLIFITFRLGEVRLVSVFVEAFEVEEKASESKLGKVEDVGLYQFFQHARVNCYFFLYLNYSKLVKLLQLHFSSI